GKLGSRIGVVDLRDQFLQLVAYRVELRQQLVRTLRWLVALLHEHARLQPILNLRDPLLKVGPMTECFSNDHVCTIADKTIRNILADGMSNPGSLATPISPD